MQEWFRSTIGIGARAAIRNGAHLAVLHWIETVLGAFYIIVIARLLGATVYGYWSYGVTSYALIIGLTGFGFDTLMAIKLGAGKDGVAEYLGLTLTLRLALLLLGAMALVTYALWVEPDRTSRLVLLLLLPALIGRGLAIWVRVCFLGYERMGEHVKFAGLLRCAEVGSGTIYLFFGGGLVGLSIIHSVSWLAEGIIGLVRVRRLLSPWMIRFDRRDATDLLRQGAVLGTSAGLYQWLLAGPVILIRYVAGNMAELGQFVLVQGITMILVSSGLSLLVGALPALSRAGQRNEARIASYGRTILVTTACTAATLGTLGWMLGPPLVNWVLGAEYATAGNLIGPFLLIGGLILAPVGYIQSLLISGARWPATLANLCAAALLTAGLPLAYKYFAIDGAVLAAGAAWALRSLTVVSIALIVDWRHPRGLRH